jgi:hypothetical protein
MEIDFRGHGSQGLKPGLEPTAPSKQRTLEISVSASVSVREEYAKRPRFAVSGWQGEAPPSLTNRARPRSRARYRSLRREAPG